MFIGIARFDLFIPNSHSLKEKRQVLRSVSDVVERRFKVAIAEVDYQDLWQRAAFGVSCVAGSMSHCRKVLAEVEKAIGRAAVDGAEIIDRSQHIIAMDDL